MKAFTTGARRPVAQSSHISDAESFVDADGEPVFPTGGQGQDDL